MQFSREDPMVLGIYACSLASFGVWALAYGLGLTKPPVDLAQGIAFTTYFEAINWWPFPAFFLLMIPAMRLTWAGFTAAWRDLVRTEVLYRPDGAPVSEADLRLLADALQRRRRFAYGAALAATLLVSAIDAAPMAKVIIGDASSVEQMAHACQHKEIWTKWLWEVPEFEGTNPCTVPLPIAKPRLEPPPGAIIFWLTTVLQQGLLIFFIAAALAQLMLHTALFGAFRRLMPEMTQAGLDIRLNAASPVSEFGLEHWNYVLNNFYWFSCPALLMVFFSRGAVEEDLYQPGQEMLGVVVPALLLLPMVATIFSRQAHLPAVWHRLEEDGQDGYARQQLWPLDRNWSSKLGIILAFSLAALSLGYQVQQFLGVA
ncbi:MAG: hypothetical protein AAGH74_02720 [Pseudomonadota bacterium]